MEHEIIYNCKENDCTIKVYTLNGNIDELQFGLEQDKCGFVVIGFKDLQVAIKKAEKLLKSK